MGIHAGPTYLLFLVFVASLILALETYRADWHFDPERFHHQDKEDAARDDIMDQDGDYPMDAEESDDVGMDESAMDARKRKSKCLFSICNPRSPSNRAL